ncbi:MAG TPA: MFS transporter [Acidimicrobiales bacterium]
MPVAGWLVDRVGIRVPALLGFGIVASTMWVLGHLEASMPESRIVFVLVIQGVGTGFAYVPTTVGAMNAVPDRYAAQASAVQNLDRQLAGAIGIAVLGALLVSDLGAVASSDIDPDAAQAAYNRTFIVAFWVAVVGGALSIFLPSDRRKEASGSETGLTTQ